MVRCVMCVVVLACLPVCSSGQAKVDYVTRLNPGTRLGIVRRPAAWDGPTRKLDRLPKFDPESSNPFQVDLRGRDLSALALTGAEADLRCADFDEQTVWPGGMARGGAFDPARFMLLGRSPGLGLRALHARGLTGKGVGIAIIDQPLLVDHAEYRDRLRTYEEIHWPAPDTLASMHGPAVASIAVGKTVGVAPGADLYYIAEFHGTMQGEGRFEWDFTYLARAIDRVLAINASLPTGRRIRVISTSVGWGPTQKGYAEVAAAVARARKQGILVVSTSLSETYRDVGASFNGLGRDPLEDPDRPASYGAGLWWARFLTTKDPQVAAMAPRLVHADSLLVPMDSRCTAAPTGAKQYVFYRGGGWSWAVPYIAGLYALACQAKPGITPEQFLKLAVQTGTPIEVDAGGQKRPIGRAANPAALIEALGAKSR